jgi:hypothetical protein
MAGKRWFLWVAAAVLGLTSMGCCRFCERWCGTPPHYPVTCCQPCCVPVCCPAPAVGPAPAGYQPQATSWSQPRAGVPNGCCP